MTCLDVFVVTFFSLFFGGPGTYCLQDILLPGGSVLKALGFRARDLGFRGLGLVWNPRALQFRV